MTLAAIVAHDPQLVIGKDGDLPWHFSEDLKHFKSVTMGHPMIMGRGVFEGLNEKPLPGRENIVLSRTKDYDHVPTFSSFEEAMEYLEGEELVFLIGGGELYSQFLFRVDQLFVTEIHQAFDGDTFFPEYRDQVGTSWEEVSRENRKHLSFVRYKRL